jgi:DNA ligase 1
MNTQQVFNLIEEIAAVSAKTEKERLVKQGMEHDLFRKVMRAAYDPFINYGLAGIPKPVGKGAGTMDGPVVWAIIEQLASRKLSGNDARTVVEEFLTEKLDAPSAHLFWRIIKKDMRAGFGENTLNKAIKGFIATFPYMRCTLPKDADMDSWDWSQGVISQEKADGMFANFSHDDAGSIWISSRQGSPFPIHEMHAEFMAAILQALPRGTQTHGELLVYRNDILLPREEGNGVLNSLLNGGSLGLDEEVRFFAWDQVPLSAVQPKAKFGIRYRARLMSMLGHMKGRGGRFVQPVATRIVKSKAEAMDHYREMLSLGKEGTIVSNPDGIWKDGTSKDKVKFKLEVPVELRVKGFNEGTGKNEGALGSFICESECGQLKVDVSGRGDAMRVVVWANRDSWLDAIITVKANSIMAPKKEGDLHSLFLPIFVERRTDKDQADTLVSIEAQFAAAMGL